MPKTNSIGGYSMKTKGISRVVALLLLFTLLLSVSPLTEVAWAAEAETGAAESVPQETAASETEEPEALPPCGGKHI